MNKIILKDSTEIEFKKSDGLTLTMENITGDEVEKVLTEENLKQVQISNDNVYGNYENLELISITKIIKSSNVIIRLKEPTNIA